MTFSGAVLTGGGSRRMGRDKALLEVDGRPLALVAVDALVAAGASEVVCVGGDSGALRALGLVVVPDRHPADGPLGGVITALHQSSQEIVVILSCDLPNAVGPAIRAVVDALDATPDAEVAAPVAGGYRQLLHAAYRRRSLPHWEGAYASGERSLHRPAARLAVIEVGGLDPAWLHDVDTPEDLPGPTG